jgi:hypothetical protein
LDIGYWLLVIGYWLLVIAFWFLLFGYVTGKSENSYATNLFFLAFSLVASMLRLGSGLQNPEPTPKGNSYTIKLFTAKRAVVE